MAAMLTAILSSLCCIGPLIYLLFGISAAALTGIQILNYLQIPMITLSVGLLLLGFWRLYFSKKPFCAGRLTRKQTLSLYWCTLPIILLFQLYPFILPWIIELVTVELIE